MRVESKTSQLRIVAAHSPVRLPGSRRGVARGEAKGKEMTLLAESLADSRWQMIPAAILVVLWLAWKMRRFEEQAD
jgi:hypothetical protein